MQRCPNLRFAGGEKCDQAGYRAQKQRIIKAKQRSKYRLKAFGKQ
jgi:hypothetical protein